VHQRYQDVQLKKSFHFCYTFPNITQSQVHRLESYVHVMGSSKDTSNGVGILDPVTVAVDCAVTYIPLHPTVRHISCQVLLYSTANYTECTVLQHNATLCTVYSWPLYIAKVLLLL
jgi:hypothetical protein